MRRTEFDYEERTEWLSRYLVQLRTSERVYQAGSSTPISQVDYSYDTDSNLVTYPTVPMHVSNVPNYRGNLTKVVRNTNASNPTSGQLITKTNGFDETGNVARQTDANGNATQTAFSSEFAYAYPTTVTSPIPDPDGNQGLSIPLVNSMSFNFNTGLVVSTTDVNNQTTYFAYDELTNRASRIDAPGGGWTTYEYSDSSGDTYVNIRKAFDGSRYTDLYQYFDGSGRLTRVMENGEISSCRCRNAR